MRKSAVVSTLQTTLHALLLTGALSALPAHALDLLGVYQQALANDAVYVSARAALAAGQEKSVQARAGLLPTVALSGAYNKGDFEVRGVPGTRSYSSNAYTLSLAQPLFRWANWEQYQQGKLSTALSEVQFSLAQQDLILRVSQAYFDVLAAQDGLAAVQAQQTSITEQLASAKRNFEVGTATITDTHEAQARFDLTMAQTFAAQNDLEIKRTALEQIIGNTPAALATLRTGVMLRTPQPAQIEPWVTQAQQQNYNVVAQTLTLEIAKREIKKGRAGHAPTLDLVASHNRTDQSGSPLTPLSSVSNTNSIGVQWTIPLFSGFAVTSKVREAIALEDKAGNDLESARRSAAQGARQAYLGVNNGLAQVKALEAAEASSKLALDANQLGYQVGVRINIDVLNAQQQLYATQRDLAKARYDTIVNGLRLKASSAALSISDLEQINALLVDMPSANRAPASGASSAAPAKLVKKPAR